MTTQRRTDDAIAFLKGIIKAPMVTGAIAPSGPVLARIMAEEINLNVPGPILELGPGTGNITRAILKHGVAPDRLITIEYNPSFCSHIRHSFPGVEVVQGSAFDVVDLWRSKGWQRPAYVVSGLPLLNFPTNMRVQLLRDCLDLAHPDGGFIQFTYSGKSSVPHMPHIYTTKLVKRVWQNFPPATVWRYDAAHQSAFAPKHLASITQELHAGAA
jgi:phosphatidylethanolamine/phosphatidyl-N-methylethanolamine N-methyltransferase